MKPGSFLIICFDFPPTHAIGGRRWSKLAKSFVRLGHRVSVISCRPLPGKSTSASWIGQEYLDQMDIHLVRKPLLVRWLNNYHDPMHRIKIPVAAALMKLFCRGTIFDRATGLERRITSLAKEIIRSRSVSHVFVTGAPFNLLYYAAQLRDAFPGLVIVADYRDPWITAQNYGMRSLSDSRKRCELRKQNFVLNHVDLVTCPNEFLLREIRDSYTGDSPPSARFLELPHAFDPEDVLHTTRLTAHTEPTVRIIYGGTLYLGVEKYLQLLHAAVLYARERLLTVKLKIDVFANEMDEKEKFADDLRGIDFHHSVGEKIFEEAANSDYILILLAQHNKDFVTSKFFEFLPYGKPYLYLGPRGFVSEKIEREGLGYCIWSQEDLYTVLSQHNQLHKKQAPLQLSSYTFDHVASKFLDSLNIDQH